MEMDTDIDTEMDMDIDTNIETNTADIADDNEPEEEEDNIEAEEVEVEEMEEVEEVEEKETQVKDPIEIATEAEAGTWSVARHGKKKKNKNRNENDRDRENYRTNKERIAKETSQHNHNYNHNNHKEIPNTISGEFNSNKAKAQQTTDRISHPPSQTKKNPPKKKEKMKGKKQEKNPQNHGLEKSGWTTTTVVPDSNPMDVKTHVPQGMVDMKQTVVKPTLSSGPYTRTTKPLTTQKNINNANDSFPIQKDTNTGINIKINTNSIANTNANTNVITNTISPNTNNNNNVDIGINLNNVISKEPLKPLVRPTRPPVANNASLSLAGIPIINPVRLPHEIQVENKVPTVSNTATLAVPNNTVSYQDGLQHLLQSLYPPLATTTAIPTAVNWTPSTGSTFPQIGTIPYLATPAAMTTFPNPLLFANQTNGVNVNLKPNVATNEYIIKDLSTTEQKDEWINFDLDSHSYPSSLWTLNLKSLRIHPDCSLDKLKVLMKAK